MRGNAHTNGIESFWSMLKRGHYGVYHHYSVKHIHRYVNEFKGRHNARPLDTIDQMASAFLAGIGKSLRFLDLIGPREAHAAADAVETERLNSPNSCRRV